MSARRPTTRSVLLAALGVLTLAAAQGRALLEVYSYNQYSLRPGVTLPERLQTADGSPAPLPGKGRALLWLETSEQVTEADDLRHAKPDLLRLSVSLGPTFLVFTGASDRPIPARSRRGGVAARFPGVTVLYDERDALRDGRDRDTAPLYGLYLIKDGEVVCRYSSQGSWDVMGIRAGVVNDLRAFMRGEKVDSCPEPLNVPGARVNTAGLPGAGKVRLLFRVAGNEVDAPPNSISFTVENLPGGGSIEKGQSKHPASDYRARIELLTPVVKAAGAVPIAVLYGDADLDKFRRTWPDWTFIPSSAASNLRWSELQGAVLAPDGRVKLSFIAFPGASGNGADSLRAALKDEP